MTAASEIFLPVRDYDLAATLDSGQVFRWRQVENSWHGVVGGNFVKLAQIPDGIRAETFPAVEKWDWLREFLQPELDFVAVLNSFPDDEPMRNAVAACRGLRLLRQEPWECLASFICSSTKQIVQIRQIVEMLCQKFGDPIEHRGGPAERRKQPRDSGFLPKAATPALFAFPSPQKIAAATEAELRECKMGFRAPSLLNAAREVAGGCCDLEKIRKMDYATARAELMKLRGVGEKIADCVLLFAYGFDGAFPVDVWVERALQNLYFSRRRASEKRLRKFAATYFGPHAGYAQQYLFHYMRTKHHD
jgi:N-glycosylase/DNA lyase